MNPQRPVLSLAELEAFDGGAASGERRRFCCPLCGQTKPRDASHRSLSVDAHSGLWKCFRCEASGQLREHWPARLPRVRSGVALARAFSLDAPVRENSLTHIAASFDAPLLSADAPVSPAPLEFASSSASSKMAPTVSWRASLAGLQPLAGSRGQSYLEGRGLSGELCVAARVKWAPSWMGRPAVAFPLYNALGELVAAQGRYTDGRQNPKARTLGPKKEGVFQTPDFWSLVKRGAPVAITEAPIDALSLAACGFPALALCGKSGHPSWLAIRCAFKDVALAFDADEAGEDGAARLAPELAMFGARVRRLAPEGAKDWNEMLLGRGADSLGDWLSVHLLR